jgi:F1F0 ATPase subunit 2
MKMNDLIPWAMAAAAGVALGAVFFGGLWWTIRRGLVSPHPVLWFLGSALARMGIAVLGFYHVGQGDPGRLVACLVGFLAARVIVTRLTRCGKEANDAP